MATIGSFTASGNGFTGTIKTLNLHVKATIRTVERTADKAPTTASSQGQRSSGSRMEKNLE